MGKPEWPRPKSTDANINALFVMQAPTELRAKTQRLLGRQSLVEYIAEKWKVKYRVKFTKYSHGGFTTLRDSPLHV